MKPTAMRGFALSGSLQSASATTTLVRPAAVADLRSHAGAADARRVVSPEYAHAMPRVLHTALDWLRSLERVIRWLRRSVGLQSRQPPLLPLSEVRRRLDLVEHRYVGTRAIPIDRIVGTLDRSRDFDRRFRPVRAEQQHRLDALRRAFPNNDFPPIVVYEIGGAYFVSDGHHRVALAYERGMVDLDAEVTRIRTRYALPPDVDLRQVIHTQQREQFMEQSGLARARPEAVIEFSCPHSFAELLELIKAFGYDLQRTSNRLMRPEDIAAAWYDSVYVPGVRALRQERVTEAFSHKQDADLFLWMYQQRRRLLVEDDSATYQSAARMVRSRRRGRRELRELERDRSTPLSLAGA